MSKACNTAEFHRAVGSLNSKRLKSFGIIPVTADGLFLVDMVTQLLRVCEKNPTYHVATIIDYGVHVNRFLPDGHFYMLCEGDSDPEIIGYWPSTLESYHWLKVYRFDHDED